MINKIVVDAFGSDNGPKEIIEGIIRAINENNNIKIVISGNENIIINELSKYTYNKEQIEIINAMDIITNNDIPTIAIREKKDSSLIKAISYLKENDETIGFISAGSTGAVLCSATLLLGRLPNITRPSLSTILPTEKGNYTCLLDCGANVDCKKEMLEEFAYMGSSFMEAMYNTANPKVALLSVGTEDKKGNELTKGTFELLKKSSLNFVGNMEAREALSGNYDVIVTDGFLGNVLLKTIEGTAKMILNKTSKKLIENNITSSKNILTNMMKEMDFNSLGGAVFLGVKKIVVKTHGISNASTIYHAINQVIKLSNGNLIEKISNATEKRAVAL